MASISLDPRSQVLVRPIVEGVDGLGQPTTRNDTPVYVTLADLAEWIAEHNAEPGGGS